MRPTSALAPRGVLYDWAKQPALSWSMDPPMKAVPSLMGMRLARSELRWAG